MVEYRFRNRLASAICFLIIFLFLLNLRPWSAHIKNVHANKKEKYNNL